MNGGDVVCPSCRVGFERLPDQLACPSCGQRYPVKNGIPIIKKDSDYFYDYEFSRDEYRRMVDRAEKDGWYRAFAESRNRQGKPISDFNIFFNSDERKAVWKYLLPVSTQSRVLDYGSGFGNISSGLSRVVGEVVSMEPTFERLRMWQIRARQTGITNVSFVCSGGDSPKLPFQDGDFDLVVLNGVLEWIPESVREGAPRRVQLEALKEVRRVLKNDGVLYIGIENRLALQYFLGALDHHAGLRFATLLPRRLADAYSKLVKGRPYRVYTYSWWGYKKLLMQAGFHEVGIYWPHPDYAAPQYIIDASDQRTIDYLVDQSSGSRVQLSIMRALAKTGWLKYLLDTYSLVAR